MPANKIDFKGNGCFLQNLFKVLLRMAVWDHQETGLLSAWIQSYQFIRKLPSETGFTLAPDIKTGFT